MCSRVEINQQGGRIFFLLRLDGFQLEHGKQSEKVLRAFSGSL